MVKIFIAVSILASVYLVMQDDVAMSQCEVSHSHGTCLYSLSR